MPTQPYIVLVPQFNLLCQAHFIFFSTLFFFCLPSCMFFFKVAFYLSIWNTHGRMHKTCMWHKMMLAYIPSMLGVSSSYLQYNYNLILAVCNSTISSSVSVTSAIAHPQTMPNTTICTLTSLMVNVQTVTLRTGTSMLLSSAYIENCTESLKWPLLTYFLLFIILLQQYLVCTQ